jgi:general secretion pathway protein K
MTAPRRRRGRIELAPSHDSRARERARKRRSRGGGKRRRSEREQGVALVMALSAVAILAVFVADMHENTSTALAVAASQREQVQAEYMAKSAINLTRLLVGNERAIRDTVAPIYQMMVGRQPPQIPVWTMATELLMPFCDLEQATGSANAVGIDLGDAQGFEGNPAKCEITAIAENSMINVNDPLARDGDQARRGNAMQLFALMGGYQAPSAFDPLFSRPDPDGQQTSRLDIVSAVIDWWDQDTQRTIFDPGASSVDVAGAEDDVYATFDDPYRVKNAPYDSLEELRLIRGVGDDFWATFIEPQPDDPLSRTVTIYGSGAVNANTAPPQVLLARLCSFVESATLCADPGEAAKFVQLITTVRSLFPIPLFSRPEDFLSFLEGAGGARDLYPMMVGMLGPDNPLIFTPITVPQDKRREILASFLTGASIHYIEATGFAGRSEVRIKTVINFHSRWQPPPPNPGAMGPLGVFHYYRVE